MAGDPVTASTLPYRAFISYSHQDKSWADWLHKALETYRVPSRLVGSETAAGIIPRRLAPIFRDRDELASATDLGRKVNEALARSANLIVVCSPHSATSRWVGEEVLAFKRIGRAERIFCLIVDGEPNATDLPGRESEECFASALRFAIDANGQPTTTRTEPIAADARAGKDGRTNAKLKLIAGLLDVGFDALKQREQQRRNRRMAAITALALIVMTVTTALAISAVIARRAAVVAQQAAERRQKQAESLVGFMLGDLTDKLREVSRLDILQTVDDKAMAYFDSLPAADATDATLALRVTALQKIGSVRQDQGHMPQALDSYRAAAGLAEEVLRRSPADAARQAAYAYSLTWVGNAYWHQDDLDHALQNFQTASALLGKAHAATRGDNDLSVKLAIAHNNIGHVLEARGALVVAQGEYEAMLQIYQSLHQREPDNPTWQSDLGDAWDNLGKVALEQGHLDRAIEDYRADQQVKAAIAARDPANHDAQGNLLVSNAILGRTLALCGDMEAASRYTRAAVDSAKTLVIFDPADASNQESLALYSQQLGGLLRQAGQLSAAEAADTEAIAIFAKLVAKDPSNTGWRKEYAQTRIEAARQKLQQDDAASAHALTEAALQALDTLPRKHGPSQSLTLLSAQANLVLGEIAANRGDIAAARDAWNRARDTAAPVVNVGDDPNALVTAASASLLLGEADKAQPSIAKLAAMGYRAPDFDALLAAKHVAYAANADAARRITAAMQDRAISKANP